MKALKGLTVILILAMLLPACQERMICPAYQSTFILDDEVRYNLFSRFEQDSVPKEYGGVDKNIFGIVKKTPRKKRERELAIVAMKNVLPQPKEDSLTTSATDITPLKRELERD